MARALTAREKASWTKNGYLIIRNLLTEPELCDLQQWTQEVHDWPTDATSPWMPYEEINASGKRVLCRTENFAASHTGLNSLLRGKKILGLLRDLAGEDYVLFKEKINYKLAGSGGFAPHIDSAAYTHVKKIKHLAILFAVDRCDMSNGGLEVVAGSHEMDVPIGKDNVLEPAWTAQQEWTPVNLDAGQLLIFGSYLAHRSGPNFGSQDRKALYATYNRKVEGDLHDTYYEQRKAEYPPSHLRAPGEKFEIGSLRYGFGSPMLSVDIGHQLIY